MQKIFSKGMILLTVILMDILGGAELDLFVPSFPELQNHFGISTFWVEALLSVNFIGFCLSLFFVGALSDRYGRKPIIITGIILFIIGSAFCLYAPSYEFLISGRFLQGLGIAAPTTLCFLIIADSYPLKQQQYLLAMMNGVMNASVGAAPIVGSYVTIYFHWQGNFMLLFLLGLVTLLMTIFFIPTHKLPEQKETLSFSGYIPIFKSTPMMLLLVHVIFAFVPYCIFVGTSSILYIENLGVSLSRFGFYQGSIALTFAFGSVLFGLLISRYEQKKLLHLSIPLCILSLVVTAFVTLLNSSNPLVITLTYLLITVSQVVPGAILFPLCLNFMPHAKGRVSAVLQGGRLLLSSFSLQIAGYYYAGSFQNIGIIITCLLTVALITLFLVVNSRELMKSPAA